MANTPKGKQEKIALLVEPIKPVPTFMYRCDDMFHIGTLKDMLIDDVRYGFIVVGGNGVLFAVLNGNTKTILKKHDVSLPKKHNKGGQSSVRFARLRESAHHNYLRKVSELATELFISKDDGGTPCVNVKGIIVAGVADIKNKLTESNMFDSSLQKVVLDVVDVAYDFNAGLEQAIDLSSHLLKDVKLIEEKNCISSFMTEISKDSRKITFGVQQTMAALEMGAVKTLILSEKIDKTRIVVENDAKQRDMIFDKTKVCDRTIVETCLLFDWLLENYKSYGSTIQTISDSFAEGHQFLHGFGGIAALLRYDVDMCGYEEEADCLDNEFY